MFQAAKKLDLRVGDVDGFLRQYQLILVCEKLLQTRGVI